MAGLNSGINLVCVWHESTVFTDAERAVLAYTDSPTLVAQTRSPDADYEELRAHFSESDIAKMIMVIGAINAWNRIAVGTLQEAVSWMPLPRRREPA